MHVDVIQGDERLLGLRENWNAVYEADPDAQFFLSWIWMSRWLAILGQSGMVLAARPDGQAGAYAAFLPLRFELLSAEGGGCSSVVKMAGEIAADCTGMLARPEFENDAIKAFTRHIQNMGWRHIVFHAFRASDSRMNAISRCFPRKLFGAKDFKDIYPDGTDHGIFPYIELPSDWDDYLSNSLGSETRRKVRRFLRQVDDSDEFAITVSEAETLDRDLDILFKFWWLKWASETNKLYIKHQAMMLRHCFEMGTLYLTVLWQNDRPLGALANLRDDAKEVMLFKIMSRDESFGNPSPNFVLYANAIRHAIGLGYRRCEFLQGNHRFKYSFGADDYRVFFRTLSRRPDRPSGPTLDKSCLPAALAYAAACRENGRFDEAERGYRQVLKLEPGSREAAAGLDMLRRGATKRRR